MSPVSGPSLVLFLTAPSEDHRFVPLERPRDDPPSTSDSPCISTSRADAYFDPDSPRSSLERLLPLVTTSPLSDSANPFSPSRIPTCLRGFLPLSLERDLTGFISITAMVCLPGPCTGFLSRCCDPSDSLIGRGLGLFSFFSWLLLLFE